MKEDEISELTQKKPGSYQNWFGFFKGKYSTLIFQNAEKYRQLQLERVVSKVRAFLRKRMMMWVSPSRALVRKIIWEKISEN